jgi:hypothetical protein
MKRACALLVLGTLLVSASAVGAGDLLVGQNVPGPSCQSPLPVVAVSGCPPCADERPTCWGRFLDWLCYRPLPCQKVCGSRCGCFPPLYLFFLDHGPCRHPGYVAEVSACGPCAGKGLRSH